MEVVVNFIVSNYIWILVVIIVLLLAIIGGFADKTNFGEGQEEKNDNKNENPTIDISNTRIDDLVSKDKNETVTHQNVPSEQINEVNKEVQQNVSQVESGSLPNSNNANLTNDVSNKTIMKSLEQKLSDLDKEINLALPESDTIGDSTLDDISNLSLDVESKFKTKKIDKIKTNDLELPKIKSFNKEDDDVWK